MPRLNSSGRWGSTTSCSGRTGNGHGRAALAHQADDAVRTADLPHALPAGVCGRHADDGLHEMGHAAAELPHVEQHTHCLPHSDKIRTATAKGGDAERGRKHDCAVAGAVVVVGGGRHC